MSTILSGVLALCVAFCAGRAAWAVDPPHSSRCRTCHSLHGGSAMPECTTCHVEGGSAPAVATHSSAVLGAAYGDWHLDCADCHDPHVQQQDQTWGTSWGMYLRVEIEADVKEIDPLDTGPDFTALGVLRTVGGTEIRHVSAEDFVDADGESLDDVCQACHLETAYYAAGSNLGYHQDYGAASQPGGECTLCHTHEAGWGVDYALACGVCHGIPPASPHPTVADGLLGCTRCHGESVDAAGEIIPASAGGLHMNGVVDGGGHEAEWMDTGSTSFHALSANAGLSPCQDCHGADLAGG